MSALALYEPPFTDLTPRGRDHVRFLRDNGF